MIAVTGGSGVMGTQLVRALVARGERVRALVLPADPANARLDDVDCEVVRADITRPAQLEGALDSVTTLYHLAAVILSKNPAVFARVNVEGTRNLVAEGLKAGVGHLIYVSSASVTYPYTTPYSASKREAERIVREQGAMRYTIARPTLVYDNGGGEEFMMFFELLRRAPVVPFVGDGMARKRPVWVGDLVTALVAMADNPVTYGKTYNLSGPEALPLREMARQMLDQLGLRRPFLHIPLPLCRAVAWGLGRVMRAPPFSQHVIAGLTLDADLDGSDAERDLAYRPIPFREGLRRCFPQ